MNFLYAYFKPHQWLPHRVSSPNQTDRSRRNANWKRQDEGLVLLFERTRGEGGDRGRQPSAPKAKCGFSRTVLWVAGKGLGGNYALRLQGSTPSNLPLSVMKVRLIYEIEINSHTLSEKSLDYSNSFVALH